MSEHPFHHDLRAELVRAANQEYGTPKKRPGGRWLLATAAVLTAVLVLGALSLRSSDTVSADLEIVVDGDDLIVRLANLDTSREEIEAAAEEFGLNLTIDEVPVGPSNVGTFAGAAGSEFPPELEPLGGQRDRFTGFRIPRDWDGELTLSLGRSAEPGEMWMVFSDAQAEGEPLECMQLIGLTAAEVRDRIAESELPTRWLAHHHLSNAQYDDVHDGIANWIVIAVEALGPDDIFVQLTEDGSWPGPSVEDGGIPPPTNPDC